MENPEQVEQWLSPQRAKAKFNATHYTTMKDGVTPQMYYKKETNPLNDGTSWTCWVYLSYCNLWQGSAIRVGSKEEASLTPIETGD